MEALGAQSVQESGWHLLTVLRGQALPREEASSSAHQPAAGLLMARGWSRGSESRKDCTGCPQPRLSHEPSSFFGLECAFKALSSARDGGNQRFYPGGQTLLSVCPRTQSGLVCLRLSVPSALWSSSGSSVPAPLLLH